MICDELNPNCLLKVCCSEICTLVANEIDRRKAEMDLYKEAYLEEAITHNHCPICRSKGTYIFQYDYDHYRECQLRIQAFCSYCKTSIKMIRSMSDNHDYYIPDKYSSFYLDVSNPSSKVDLNFAIETSENYARAAIELNSKPYKEN